MKWLTMIVVAGKQFFEVVGTRFGNTPPCQSSGTGTAKYKILLSVVFICGFLGP